MVFYTIYTHREWLYGLNWRYIDLNGHPLSIVISANDCFSTVAYLLRPSLLPKPFHQLFLPPDSSIISPNAIVLIFEILSNMNNIGFALLNLDEIEI
ncbi:MAG TPA: hypothetical protein VF233_06455 [Nitrososphaeraceae archaeon]